MNHVSSVFLAPSSFSRKYVSTYLCVSVTLFACTHFKGESDSQSDKVAINTQQSCDKLTHGKARFLFFAYETR